MRKKSCSRQWCTDPTRQALPLSSKHHVLYPAREILPSFVRSPLIFFLSVQVRSLLIKGVFSTRAQNPLVPRQRSCLTDKTSGFNSSIYKRRSQRMSYGACHCLSLFSVKTALTKLTLPLSPKFLL